MSSGNYLRNNLQPYHGTCGWSSIGDYYEKTWSGADDPIKHKKPNSYTMRATERRVGVCLWRSKYDPPNTVNTGTWSSCFGGGAPPSLNWRSNDDLNLLNKLGESIKGHTFNAAVSVGAEGREALSQIAGAAESLVYGMRSLRHKNIKGALDAFGLHPKNEAIVGLHKSLSGKVLATQLGWLPLMGDIQSASEALFALTSNPMSATFTVKRQLREPLYAYSGDAGSQFGERILSKRLSWTLSEELSWAESLGLSNCWDIADMAWNATSLSFIADWFIPIGSYLSARSVVNVLKGSGFSTLYDRTQTQGIQNLGPFIVMNPLCHWYKDLRITRVPLSSLSGLVALPKFKDFSSVPNWKRALTAVTLATQMFAK